MSRNVFLVAAALAAGLASAAGAAPAPTETEANSDSALAGVVASLQGTPVSLDEALGLAVRHSTDARAAEAGLLAARGAVRREKGAFDPQLFGGLSRTSSDAPSASAFSGADVVKTDLTSGQAGAKVTLPMGTQLSATLSTLRQETNSSLASLNPQYGATGVLSVTQPLLNGFGPGTRGNLSAAERAEEAGVANYEDAVLGVLSATERTYWQLYAAERDFAVQQLIRDRAAAFLEQTRLRASAGLVGPSQVASAQVFLAEQDQALLDREEEMDRTSDQLATQLGQRPPARYLASGSPPENFPTEPEDSLVARAALHSRQLAAAERTAAAAHELARAARWNALPTLNVFGSLGANGVAGTGQTIIFGADTIANTTLTGGGDAFRQVTHRQFPSWTAGVAFSVPLGARAGGGERDRLEAEAERADQQLRAVRLSLEERVRSSSRELAHATRRLDAARSGVQAAVEQVRIGQLEYNAGRATAFELVRLRADLATAQQRYSQALVRAATSAAEIRRLTSSGIPETPNR